MAVMAAVVATLFYAPAAVACALLVRMLGASPEAVATFGGRLGLFAGLLVWWLLAFIAACIYAACAFPWESNISKRPSKEFDAKN